jgi:hypothetical protein
MKNYWKYGGFKIFKNKYFEYQVEGKGFSKSWFEFILTWRYKCDHAGPNLVFSLLDLFFADFAAIPRRDFLCFTDAGARPDLDGSFCRYLEAFCRP